MIQLYEIFDDYAAYYAKKQEVLHGTDPVGSKIVHCTPNQEGCETAILTIVDGERTFHIIRYDDI